MMLTLYIPPAKVLSGSNSECLVKIVILNELSKKLLLVVLYIRMPESISGVSRQQSLKGHRNGLGVQQLAPPRPPQHRFRSLYGPLQGGLQSHSKDEDHEF